MREIRPRDDQRPGGKDICSCESGSEQLDRVAWGQGGMETGRHGDRATWRHGDRVAWRQGGMETGRHGDRATWRHGDRVAWRQGGMGTGRQGGREAWGQGSMGTGQHGNRQLPATPTTPEKTERRRKVIHQCSGDCT